MITFQCSHSFHTGTSRAINSLVTATCSRPWPPWLVPFPVVSAKHQLWRPITSSMEELVTLDTSWRDSIMISSAVSIIIKLTLKALPVRNGKFFMTITTIRSASIVSCLLYKIETQIPLYHIVNIFYTRQNVQFYFNRQSCSTTFYLTAAQNLNATAPSEYEITVTWDPPAYNFPDFGNDYDDLYNASSPLQERNSTGNVNETWYETNQ